MLRRRSKPRGIGFVVVDCCDAASSGVLVSRRKGVDEAAAAASAESSSALSMSPMEQLMKISVGGSRSTALPFPLGSGGGRGGGAGILRTLGSKAVSGRIFPLYIRRKRRDEVGGGSLLRMRCLRDTTVVLEGCETSRDRSGIDAVNRTVMWRVLNTIIGVDGREVAIVGKKIQLQVGRTSQFLLQSMPRHLIRVGFLLSEQRSQLLKAALIVI